VAESFLENARRPGAACSVPLESVRGMQIGAFGARQEVVGSGQPVGPAFEVERPAGIAATKDGRDGAPRPDVAYVAVLG
jgi:hypothetical protein